MKKLSLMAFVCGLCFAAFAGTNTASALTPCQQNCYANYQICLADGHTPKTLCGQEKNECLFECR